MPTIEEQRTSAIAKVKRNCQTQVEPIVDDDELDEMADDYQLSGIWEADTVYSVGDVISPTERNGHLYRCVVAGTSAADAEDEPDWPVTSSSTVLDGEGSPQLQWQENGADHGDQVFDIRGFSYDVWDLKAARAVVAVDQRTPGGGLSASQIYDHCVKQRDKFAPLLVF
jgi:hypothetical protein